MDKVCVNCGNRFGEHFGRKDTFFCDYSTYNVYKETTYNVYQKTGKITFNKTFIDSGEKYSMGGVRYSIPMSEDGINNPNILFKRKQIDAKT